MSQHGRDWLTAYARSRGMSLARAVGYLLEDAMANTPVVTTADELQDASDASTARSAPSSQRQLWYVVVDIDPASRTFFEGSAGRGDAGIARTLGAALENEHIRRLLSPVDNDVA